MYKHPKVTNELFVKYFSNLSDILLKSHEDLVYLGDMNGCPIKSNTIQNICEQYDLTNLIKEPTCHKGPTLSLLDVILVSNARRYSATLNVCCDISDFHNIIGLPLSVSRLPKNHKLYFTEVIKTSLSRNL